MSSPETLQHLELESTRLEQSETSPRAKVTDDPSNFLFTQFGVLERQFGDVADPELLEQRRLITEMIQSIRKYKLPESLLRTLIQHVYNVYPYECRLESVPDPEQMQRKIDAAEVELELFLKQLPLDEKECHELFLDVKYLLDLRFFIIFRFQQAIVDGAGLVMFNNKKTQTCSQITLLPTRAMQLYPYDDKNASF